MQSLEDWLVQTGRGDSAAFKQLYDASAARLYALCRRLMRDDSLAEDVLQEGFVKIWHNAAQFTHSKASALTWMSTIVRNQALDKLRQLKTHPDHDSAIDEEALLALASDYPEPERLHELSEEAQHLWHCLQGLKPEQRQSILAAFYQGHTHEQLANLLGKPLGTIKAWIRRGLEQLRGCLS